jgi:transposase
MSPMEYGGMEISERDIGRHHLLGMVLDRRLLLTEAAEKMGVSYRQAKRLKKSFENDGIAGLLHGNQGRTPSNKTSDDLRAKVLALSEERYCQFNDTHFTQMLGEREDIALSRETVRKIRREEGVKPKSRRRAKKHHKRRPRKVSEGLMMLWDGSPHRWFGSDVEPCCAMAAIDDATGKVVGLFFTQVECSWAYLELLRRVVTSHGIPASVYQDRHSSLKRNDSYWSIEEELAGRQDPTQVGAALEELGIEPIFATTPQAKGRVERLFKTLQDRLCAMLSLEGIKDIAGANEYAPGFIEDFNGKFSVAATDTQSAWRNPRRGLDMDRVLSFEYQASVGHDNAIRFGGVVIDIAPGPAKRSYAGVKAELRQLLDGSWRVYYKDKLIATAPANEIAEPIRARGRRKGACAATDSKWVYMASKPANTAAGNSMRRSGPGRQIGATRIA